MPTTTTFMPSRSAATTALLALARDDLAALEVLFDSLGSIAYGLAIRITGDPTTAGTVVEEAFLEVWRTAASFDVRAATAEAWVLRVVRARSIAVVRATQPINGGESRPVGVVSRWPVP